MSTLKSKLNKDFVLGEKMALDSFRRIKITEELRKRYVREYPYLRHLRDIFHFILHNMCKAYERKRILYTITEYKEYTNYGCTTLEFMDDMLKNKKVEDGVWSYNKKYNSLLKITDKLL